MNTKIGYRLCCLVYGRTDGRTDGRMDGWMDRWMGGWVGGRTDGHTWTSLAPQLLDEFYSWSVFNSPFFTGRCPVNMNIVDPQNRPFEQAVRNIMAIFLKTALNNFDYISINRGHRVPK
jgi:hypothetical protein